MSREEIVTEREQVCVVMTMGAITGAIASYLLFTKRGSELRREIVPALENFERELDHFKRAMARNARIASDSWALLNEVIGESATSRRPMANPNQTVPF